jgi:protein-glutamine gamma-glutamyltransferase
VTALAGIRPRWIELACFAALACVAALRWTALVSDPPAGGMTVAVLLATAGGAALVAVGGLRTSPVARWLLAGAVACSALAVGLLLVGLPARLLLPPNWTELAGNVNQSLDGLTDVPVPYAGADLWTRLAIILVAPLVVSLAALAAFWPTQRRAAGRICALVLLVALYLVAAAWARPGGQLASGALLLLVVAAWLWLPGLQAGRRLAALVAVALVAAVAVPAAALIEPGRALIDYRGWKLFSAQGLGFRWDQSYGPLNWPQQGTLVLEVASDQSHYWKATNLDSFDGVRWRRSSSSVAETVLGVPGGFDAERTPPRSGTDWVDRIRLSVRGLRSDFAIGAGTTLAVRETEATADGDGVWQIENELDPGDTYTALVYDPKPTAGEMRTAGTKFPEEARRYISFSLPGDSGPRTVDPGFWSPAGPRDVAAQVQGTAYEGMYALARQLALGAQTPYDAIDRIERYLRDAYDYRQDVPYHEFPLPEFVEEDRAGYCQQFSGTMALMLRMLGIPSRVAVGFSPGGRDPEENSFLVDDTDAHNWVEAFFPGTGWVTFEPTPAAAPASTQLNDAAPGLDDPALPGNQGDSLQLPDPREGSDFGSESERNPAVGPGSDRSGAEQLLVMVGLAGGLALLMVGAYVSRRIGTRRLDPDRLADSELRELAGILSRLGRPLGPGSTLLRAEDRLAELAGPPAAAYAARLRERRYRRPELPPPTLAERRSLRRALLGANGPRALLRVLRAMPPGGPRH